MSQDEELPLTAKSWLLMQYSENKYWRSLNPMQKHEFASLTKMYTLQACLDLNQQFNIKPQQCWVQIIQSTQCGTQAGLVIGNYLSLQHIYYGLMLPSGNDAALILAYYYGYFMGRKDKFYDYYWEDCKYITIQGKKKYNKIYLARFVSYINKNLVKDKLGHTDTHFQNPHGLSDKLQRSTAWQLANATMCFLKSPKFSQIVQTQTYTATYRDGQTQIWDNTNILLKQGYIGVKTGHTVTAGSCLCSRKVIYHNRKKYDLVLVILGCRNQEDRFIETELILKDFIRYLKMMNP